MPIGLRKIRSALVKVLGRFFFLLRIIQNLQSYGLCGILDIEKTTAHKVDCRILLRKIRSALGKVLGRFFYVWVIYNIEK